MLVCFCANAKIFDQKNIKNIYANIGSWQEYYMQVQKTRGGELNGFEFTPFISAGFDYQLKPNQYLIPEVGYIIRRTLSNGNVTKDHLFARLDYAYSLKKWLRLRAGTSLMWITMAGNGSEKTLPNGSGTETYYAPSERKNILNQTLDFGVEIIKEKISARLHSYIYAFNDEEERLTSFSLSLNYLIPMKDL